MSVPDSVVGALNDVQAAQEAFVACVSAEAKTAADLVAAHAADDAAQAGLKTTQEERDAKLAALKAALDAVYT